MINDIIPKEVTISPHSPQEKDEICHIISIENVTYYRTHQTFESDMEKDMVDRSEDRPIPKHSPAAKEPADLCTSDPFWRTCADESQGK